MSLRTRVTLRKLPAQSQGGAKRAAQAASLQRRAELCESPVPRAARVAWCPLCCSQLNFFRLCRWHSCLSQSLGVGARGSLTRPWFRLIYQVEDWNLARALTSWWGGKGCEWHLKEAGGWAPAWGSPPGGSGPGPGSLCLLWPSHEIRVPVGNARASCMGRSRWGLQEGLGKA